jgi:hypothetical protein
VAVAVLEPTFAEARVEYAELADCRDLLVTTAFKGEYGEPVIVIEELQH